MTTLRKTSGFTEVVPGDPGAPGYYRDVPVAYVESGAQCYAQPVTVYANTFRPFSSGSRNVPAGAQVVREVAGADAAGNAVYDITGYAWTETRVDQHVVCLPEFAAVYRREWVPPRPPTAASLRILGTIGWNGGARSIGTLAGDGALSFKVPTSASGVVCGLSNSDGGPGYREILYGLYCQHGTAQAIAAGRLLGSAVPYTEGAVLSVARTGGLILYMIGGYVAHATQEAAGFAGIPLIADASLYAGNDAVIDAALSGTVPTFTGAAASNPSVNASMPAFRLLASDVQSWLASPMPAFTLKAGDPDSWLASSMPEFVLQAGDARSYLAATMPAFTLEAGDVAPELLPEYNAAFGWFPEFTLECVDITVERESPPALAMPAFTLSAVSIGAGSGDGDVAYLAAPMPAFVCAGHATDGGLFGYAAFSAFMVGRPSAAEAARLSEQAERTAQDLASTFVIDELERLLAAIAAFAATDRYGRRRLIYALQTDCRDELAEALTGFDPDYTVRVSPAPPLIGYGILDVRW